MNLLNELNKFSRIYFLTHPAGGNIFDCLDKFYEQMKGKYDTERIS